MRVFLRQRLVQGRHHSHAMCTFQTYLRALALTFLACVGTAEAEELTGLWKAKGRFGPDAHGSLMIQKDGTTYSADMLGRRVPVRLEAGELRFELPGSLGRFRGKLE